MTLRTNRHDRAKSIRRRYSHLPHPLNSGQIVGHPSLLEINVAIRHPRSQAFVTFGAPAVSIVVSICADTSTIDHLNIQHPSRVSRRATNMSLFLSNQDLRSSLRRKCSTCQSRHAASTDKNINDEDLHNYNANLTALKVYQGI